MARIQLLQYHIREILLRKWDVVGVNVFALGALDEHCTPLPCCMRRLVREPTDVRDRLAYQRYRDTKVHVGGFVVGKGNVCQQECAHAGVLPRHQVELLQQQHQGL